MNPGYRGGVLPAGHGSAHIDPAEMLDQPVASFRAIFERAPIGIGLVDRDGTTRAGNPMLEELLGYTESELRSVNFNNLTHPDDVEPNATLFAELLQGLRDRFSVDKRMFRRTGEMFWARVTASLIRTEDGTPAYALGMLEDVSEQKIEEERNGQLLAELTEAQARFKIAFENAPIGMDLTTTDGRFLSVNPALCELLGYSRDELLTKRWQEVTYPDDMQASLDGHYTNLHGRGVHALHKRYVRKDGQVRWARLNSQTVRSRDGEPLYMVSQITDVTREMELEEQLRHAQKMEAVGRLAGGIAHDFNNLLLVINNYATFLAEDLDPGDAKHGDALEIVRAGQRAARLVQQLLAFSRKEASQPTTLDINDIVVDLQSLLERSVGDNIVIRSELTPGLESIKIDPTHLEQVLVNLAVNARDAMLDGGTVLFRTSRTSVDPDAAVTAGLPAGEYVQLDVRDGGVGIPDDVIGHVFEPFFTTKGRGEGTGLGLATVYGIVQRAGGRITVESTPGRGATFTVLLPAVPA